MYPRKAAADDDHMRHVTQPFCWWFKLQKVREARHLKSTEFFPKGMNCSLGWLF